MIRGGRLVSRSVKAPKWTRKMRRICIGRVVVMGADQSRATDRCNAVRLQTPKWAGVPEHTDPNMATLSWIRRS